MFLPGIYNHQPSMDQFCISCVKTIAMEDLFLSCAISQAKAIIKCAVADSA